MPGQAKTSKALREAVGRYDKTAYFKTLVRLPKNSEDDIRAAAAASGRSLNNFIVSAAFRAAGLPEPELKDAGGKPGAKPRYKKPPGSSKL